MNVQASEHERIQKPEHTDVQQNGSLAVPQPRDPQLSKCDTKRPIYKHPFASERI